ncbi:MAG: transposase [Candidatus Thiodiazotropha sp. (ex Lucinoma kastoroae)]|nr:transposase [Candidatus Thiodiazotropha sp. (ex Lucinoma kastoroae)]
MNLVFEELKRSGAEQLIYQAVEAEFLELLAEHSERRTEDGNAGVVRNGHLPERELQTGLGPVTVQIPKVRAKTGEPVIFHSALVPPYVRKTRSLEAALPWLYLKGISSGEMSEALKVLVGPDAEGMSASTVSRLKQVWAQAYRSWCEGRLHKDREELMAFYDFPAQHWQSIRTSNPIESTFGTIRHRTKRSKGCLSRDGMLHMMFKLGLCAEKKWRRLRGFDYLAKVVTGIKFKDGIEVTEVDQVTA